MYVALSISNCQRIDSSGRIGGRHEFMISIPLISCTGLYSFSFGVHHAHLDHAIIGLAPLGDSWTRRTRARLSFASDVTTEKAYSLWVVSTSIFFSFPSNFSISEEGLYEWRHDWHIVWNHVSFPRRSADCSCRRRIIG